MEGIRNRIRAIAEQGANLSQGEPQKLDAMSVFLNKLRGREAPPINPEDIMGAGALFKGANLVSKVNPNEALQARDIFTNLVKQLQPEDKLKSISNMLKDPKVTSNEATKQQLIDMFQYLKSKGKGVPYTE